MFTFKGEEININLEGFSGGFGTSLKIEKHFLQFIFRALNITSVVCAAARQPQLIHEI